MIIGGSPVKLPLTYYGDLAMKCNYKRTVSGDCHKEFTRGWTQEIIPNILPKTIMRLPRHAGISQFGINDDFVCSACTENKED